MKRIAAMLLAMTCIVPQAGAKVITQPIEYQQGDVTCSGWVSWDDAVKGQRPGVLIVHDWLGVSDYQKMRAEQLAALGYVAVAADVYGKGVRPANAQEAGAEAGKYYKDRALLRARVRAGFDALALRREADPARLAVIGYCFGGAGALELAYSGAAVRSVVTFHGSLLLPDSTESKPVQAKLLVLHGADDPFVKQDAVRAFEDEMRSEKVDWQVVQYSGAVHSFTDKRAGTDNSKGAAYNEAADRRSWRAMRDFLEETLAK